MKYELSTDSEASQCCHAWAETSVWMWHSWLYFKICGYNCKQQELRLDPLGTEIMSPGGGGFADKGTGGLPLSSPSTQSLVWIVWSLCEQAGMVNSFRTQLGTAEGRYWMIPPTGGEIGGSYVLSHPRLVTCHTYHSKCMPFFERYSLRTLEISSVGTLYITWFDRWHIQRIDR